MLDTGSNINFQATSKIMSSTMYLLGYAKDMVNDSFYQYNNKTFREDYFHEFVQISQNAKIKAFAISSSDSSGLWLFPYAKYGC